MSNAAVRVDGLLKVFDVPEREAGLVAAAKGLVRRKTRAVRAVDEISFTVDPGEVVGFLGPNGAGKTTTLKMLSGLLYPSGGEARVLGFEPSRRQRGFLSRITLVMGNRNQLQWDLPALDSYELNRAIYRIPRDRFVPTRDELIELLDIGDLVRKPVRQLSLGERMKAEIVRRAPPPAAGAVPRRADDRPRRHDAEADPRVRRRLQRALRRDRAARRATTWPTSRRCASASSSSTTGGSCTTAPLTGLADQFAAYKTIGVVLENGSVDLARYGEVIHTEGDWVTLRVPKSETSGVTARLLTEERVLDLNVEDPPIEDVIELVFAQERPE